VNRFSIAKRCSGTFFTGVHWDNIHIYLLDVLSGAILHRRQLMQHAVRYKYTAKGVIVRKTNEEVLDPSIIRIADFLRPLKPAGSFKLREDGRITTKVLQDGIWVDIEFNICDMDTKNVQDCIKLNSEGAINGEHNTN